MLHQHQLMLNINIKLMLHNITKEENQTKNNKIIIHHQLLMIDSDMNN